MKRFFCFLMGILAVALCYGQNTLWSRYFQMQRTSPTAVNRNASFHKVVKLGKRYFATTEDFNIGGRTAANSYRGLGVMIFNEHGDSLNYVNLDTWGHAATIVADERIDEIWIIPTKVDPRDSPRTWSQVVIRIDTLGNIIHKSELDLQPSMFVPGAATITGDSSLLIVGTMNPDTNYFSRPIYACRVNPNGRHRWLNNFAPHLRPVSCNSVNRVGLDSFLITASYGRSTFNVYIDGNGYEYKTEVIMSDPGRRQVVNQRLLPTSDGGYFLIGDAVESSFDFQSIRYKLNDRFQVEWADSVEGRGGYSDMMLSSDSTFTLIKTPPRILPWGNPIPDSAIFERRTLSNRFVYRSSHFFASEPNVLARGPASCVMTGNNQAFCVGSYATNFPYVLYPWIGVFTNVGQPFNPGPLNTPVLDASGRVVPSLFPNPIQDGWRITGPVADEGSTVSLSWINMQGQVLSSQSISFDQPQPMPSLVAGMYLYRLSWQEGGKPWQFVGRVVVR